MSTPNVVRKHRRTMKTAQRHAAAGSDKGKIWCNTSNGLYGAADAGVVDTDAVCMVVLKVKPVVFQLRVASVRTAKII